MSDTKFTPGPWAVNESATDEGAWEIGFGEWQGDSYADLQIATAWGFYSQAEANARLIAAAPELLECAELLESLCVWLLNACGPDAAEGREATFRLAKARAAIAKALGNA